MKRLPLGHGQPGMVLAADASVGHCLLPPAGSPLTPWHLRRLEELGVQPLDAREGPQAIPTQRPRPDVTPARLQFRQRVLRDCPPGRCQATALATGEDVLGLPGVGALLERLRAVDDSLVDHSLAVCATAIALGSRMGLFTPELKALAVGALLHDVGKLALPQPLWVKPGRLTEEEYRAIQRHTEAGYRLIRQTGLDLRAALVAYQHHERWNGTGYPRGIARRRIHPFARIVGLVDVFEALRADRPYRPACPFAEAVRYVQEQAGQAFDPHVAHTFLAWLREQAGPPGTNPGDAAGTARAAR